MVNYKEAKQLDSFGLKNLITDLVAIFRTTCPLLNAYSKVDFFIVGAGLLLSSSLLQEDVPKTNPSARAGKAK